MGYDLNVYKHSGKYVDVWLHEIYGVSITKVLFDRDYEDRRQPPEVSEEFNKKLGRDNDGCVVFKTEDVLHIIKNLEGTAFYKTIDKYGLYCTKSELRRSISELRKAYELSKDEDFMFFVITV